MTNHPINILLTEILSSERFLTNLTFSSTPVLHPPGALPRRPLHLPPKCIHPLRKRLTSHSCLSSGVFKVWGPHFFRRSSSPCPGRCLCPPIRLAIFKSMIELSVSPSFTPPPVNHRGLSGVENAALGSPDSYAHKNLIDSSQVVGASEGVLASSVSLNEALGIVGSNCCQVGFDSILDDSLFEKLCTSVALAPAISILPSACPQIFSQEKQIQFDALSATTNHSVSETDSILIVTGPELSADPLTYPQNSSREEQSHHFAQNASDVVSISVPVSGQSLGPAESSPGVSWSFVVK